MYPGKLFSRSEGEIKTFSEEQKVRKFVAREIPCLVRNVKRNSLERRKIA